MTPKHTLIHPQKQDAGRAQSRPPGATVGGPVPNGPRSQARASSGPCPASSTTLPLEADPRPSRVKAGKSPRLPRFQDSPEISTSGLIPIDFSIFADRLPVGLYSRSRSYLGPAYARIAEASTSFPVPPEGPDSGRRVSPSAVSDPSRGARSGVPHPVPLLRGRFVCGPRATWTPAQGGLSHTTPLGGCYVTGHDPSPAHAGGRVTPDRGFPPQTRAVRILQRRQHKLGR